MNGPLKSRKTLLPQAIFTLIAAVGCSTEVEPRGQLMVVISSDMSVTKDMDEVRVEVFRANGTMLPERQIPILPAQPAPFGKPLPGTLAIVPSDAGGQSLRVRLTARRLNQKSGVKESRVVREAIAKVPTDRVAMLRMPLRWLCEGKLEADEGDSYRPSCEKDETCIAGVCERAAVEQDSMPEYLPSEVFGGGTESGEGSQCLDVQTCFANAQPLQPDGDCSLPLPAGANPAQLNVALMLPPESDGHCLDDPDKGAGKGSCFIPLDSDPSEGFTIVGKKILLPPGVCMRTNFIGVALSSSCATKDLSIPVCGVWNGWAAADSGAGGTSGTGAASGVGGQITSSGASTNGGAFSNGGKASSEAGGPSASTGGGSAFGGAPAASGGASNGGQATAGAPVVGGKAGAGGAASGTAGGTSSAGAGAAPSQTLYVPASANCASGNVEAAYTVCRNCHTNPPQNGAPYPLLTLAQLQAYATDEIAQVSSKMMPLTGTLSDSNRTLMLNWLNKGAPGVPDPQCPTP